MQPRWKLIVLLSAIAIALLGRVAIAQVPPHAPGTICFTPNFWCWANPPGPPGAPCGCLSPNGYVPGELG